MFHPNPQSSHRKPPRCSSRRGRGRPGSQGFTLIEAALTTVIVGTGVLAIMAAQQAYHQKNGWAQRTNTAMLLANEIREMTAFMPMSDPNPPADQPSGHVGVESNEYTDGKPDLSKFDDLDDFAGTVDASGKGSGLTFGGTTKDALPGPINALRETIPDMKGWSQHVDVAKVSAKYIGVSDGQTYPLTMTEINGLPAMMRVTVTVLYQGPHDKTASPVTTMTWVTAGN